MYISIASTAGPPQGHRGGGGVHNTPTSNTEANNPTDPGNITTQHHRATGGGGVYPPYTMRGGGGGCDAVPYICLCIYIDITKKKKKSDKSLRPKGEYVNTNEQSYSLRRALTGDRGQPSLRQFARCLYHVLILYHIM